MRREWVDENGIIRTDDEQSSTWSPGGSGRGRRVVTKKRVRGDERAKEDVHTFP
jgi:hypothetical protein